MKRFSTTKPIYNGKSIRKILGNMPDGLCKHHRNLYIKNCIDIYTNEMLGINIGWCEQARNTNFALTEYYHNNMKHSKNERFKKICEVLKDDFKDFAMQLNRF